MGQVIKVGMADLNICKSPDVLTTIGLGSCIGIALYDPTTKISGLAHIMLPDSTQIRNNSNIAKFADTGIQKLYDDMIKAGANRSNQYRREKCHCIQSQVKGTGDSADRGRYRIEFWTDRRIIQ